MWGWASGLGDWPHGPKGVFNRLSYPKPQAGRTEPQEEWNGYHQVQDTPSRLVQDSKSIKRS